MKIVNAIIKNSGDGSINLIVISENEHKDILNCLSKIDFNGYGSIQSFIKEYQDVFSNFSIGLINNDYEVTYRSRIVQYKDDGGYLYSL